jgi:hypothetical protein
MNEYFYFINMNERGSFYADIRNSNDGTIFELFNDEETGQVQPIFDGFMKHIEDLDGLHEYLIYRKVINKNSILKKGN